MPAFLFHPPQRPQEQFPLLGANVVPNLGYGEDVGAMVEAHNKDPTVIYVYDKKGLSLHRRGSNLLFLRRDLIFF